MAVAVAGSRVENAYAWLLREITEFRLRAGAPLSETRLANQLGISRTPVREALQRLEKEGLVTRTETARFAVAQITQREVNEACDLLEILDSYIFRKAADALTETDVATLLSCVDRMQESAATGDRDGWAQADVEFHRTVNALAGNELVADTVKQVRRRVQRFWIRSASIQDRLQSCSTEHRVLAEAMAEKDYAAIEPAVKHHIGHMRRNVLDMIASASVLLGED